MLVQKGAARGPRRNTMRRGTHRPQMCVGQAGTLGELGDWAGAGAAVAGRPRNGLGTVFHA